MSGLVTPQQLKDWLCDGAELALLDVREQGIFYHEHLLFACCVPLSRLELLIADLVPRRSTRIVLCDGGPDDGGRAQQAATILRNFGYSDISLLENGVVGWHVAGFELFSGINVPSKAFGEVVEIEYGTPHLSAEELRAKQQAGDNLMILDSRPIEEYRNMSIPGGIDCPGAELVYRVHDMAPDPDTLVVVNCAGRTRSIIGAQSLRNAGIPNPVVALKDGTMGWTLAGFELDHGKTEHAPDPSPQGMAKAKACAEQVASRFGVAKIDRATLVNWRSETEQRTLYLLDVRSPTEYQAGHLVGSRNAPGGQLVQGTDEYIATRNARVVLIDDTEVRAIMTASWLIQLGWPEVYVLTGGLDASEQLSGPYQAELPGLSLVETVSAEQLQAMLASGSIAVLDFATSLQYRRGHIPGACWGLRGRLEAALAQLPEHDTLVLTAAEEPLAHLAAHDIQSLGHHAPVYVLAGGNSAWQQAGYRLTSADECYTSVTDDMWYKPYENRSAIEQHMRDYLTWEVNLVEQLERDGTTNFKLFG